MQFSYHGKIFKYQQQENGLCVKSENHICCVISKTYGEISENVYKDIVESYFELLAKEFSVKALLDLKNQEWADEAPVSISEFMGRITLTEVEFQKDGSVRLWCNDGGLFSGHSILIKCDTNCMPYKAEIVG